MKKFLLILVLISPFLIQDSFSQAPNWLWARSAGAGNSDEGLAVAVDENGYSYVTGYFASPTITFGTTTLTNAGSEDIFIAKYDTSGAVIWAKSVGGAAAERGYAIAVDANGNCYVTGYFVSSSITFGTTSLTNVGLQDIFIVKYDSSGTVLWAKSEGGSDDEYSRGVAVDAAGNCYITGNFGSPSITIGGTTYNSAGSADILVVKYDLNGTVVWSKSTGGNNWDSGNAITVDATGNSFVTGSFGSTSITFGSSIFYCSGLEDVFVVKYDATGNVDWANSEGGNLDEVGIGIALDSAGNCFANGYFQSSPIMIGTNAITGNGSYDMFVAKYDTSGNVLWAKSAGGTAGDNGYGVGVDSYGNCFSVGSFTSSYIAFGSLTLTNASAGTWDLFIAKYDATGNVLWAKTVGGSSNDRCWGVAVKANGIAHVTGYFESNTIAFGTTALTNSDSSDVYTARLATTTTTGIDDVAASQSITNIFPNPISGSTTISFSLLKPETISLNIIDVNGRLVATLVEGTFAPGNHKIVWDTENIEAGIYLLQFQSSGNLQTEKLIVTK